MSPVLAAIFAFVVVAVAIALVYALTSVLASAKMRRRMERLERGQPAPSPPEKPLKPTEAGVRTDVLPTLTHLLSGTRYTEKLMAELGKAGMRLRPSEFIGLAASGVLVLMIITTAVTRQPAAAALSAVGGPLLAWALVKTKQKKRIATFNNQIEPTLMLMSSSLRSGYSFLRAMQMVSDEMPPPIAEEFRRVVEECNVGISTSGALAHLLERIPSYDLDLVVTAVMIQLQTGGNLAEILESIAETIRERVRIAGEVAVLTAEGRISGFILVLMPIALGGILSFINPGYIKPLLTERMGQMMLGGAVMMQIMGGMVIKRMLKVEV